VGGARRRHDGRGEREPVRNAAFTTKRPAAGLARTPARKIDAGFAALEEMLGNRAWCVGDAMSLADIAIGCHLGFITLRARVFFPQERHRA